MSSASHRRGKHSDDGLAASSSGPSTAERVRARHRLFTAQWTPAGSSAAAAQNSLMPLRLIDDHWPQYLFAAADRVDGDGFTCPICLEAPAAARMFRCGHCFCASCFLTFADASTEGGSLGRPRMAHTSLPCPVCGDWIGSQDYRVLLHRSIATALPAPIGAVRADVSNSVPWSQRHQQVLEPLSPAVGPAAQRMLQEMPSISARIAVHGSESAMLRFTAPSEDVGGCRQQRHHHHRRSAQQFSWPVGVESVFLPRRPGSRDGGGDSVPSSVQGSSSGPVVGARVAAAATPPLLAAFRLVALVVSRNPRPSGDRADLPPIPTVALIIDPLSPPEARSAAAAYVMQSSASADTLIRVLALHLAELRAAASAAQRDADNAAVAANAIIAAVLRRDTNETTAAIVRHATSLMAQGDTALMAQNKDVASIMARGEGVVHHPNDRSVSHTGPAAVSSAAPATVADAFVASTELGAAGSAASGAGGSSCSSGGGGSSWGNRSRTATLVSRLQPPSRPSHSLSQSQSRGSASPASTAAVAAPVGSFSDPRGGARTAAAAATAASSPSALGINIGTGTGVPYNWLNESQLEAVHTFTETATIAQHRRALIDAAAAAVSAELEAATSAAAVAASSAATSTCVGEGRRVIGGGGGYVLAYQSMCGEICFLHPANMAMLILSAQAAAAANRDISSSSSSEGPTSTTTTAAAAAAATGGTPVVVDALSSASSLSQEWDWRAGLPPLLIAPILQVDSIRLTPDKLRSGSCSQLAHLPPWSDVRVVEVDLRTPGAVWGSSDVEGCSSGRAVLAATPSVNGSATAGNSALFSSVGPAASSSSSAVASNTAAVHRWPLRNTGRAAPSDVVPAAPPSTSTSRAPSTATSEAWRRVCIPDDVLSHPAACADANGSNSANGSSAANCSNAANATVHDIGTGAYGSIPLSTPILLVSGGGENDVGGGGSRRTIQQMLTAREERRARLLQLQQLGATVAVAGAVREERRRVHVDTAATAPSSRSATDHRRNAAASHYSHHHSDADATVGAAATDVHRGGRRGRRVHTVQQHHSAVGDGTHSVQQHTLQLGACAGDDASTFNMQSAGYGDRSDDCAAQAVAIPQLSATTDAGAIHGLLHPHTSTSDAVGDGGHGPLSASTSVSVSGGVHGPLPAISGESLTHIELVTLDEDAPPIPQQQHQQQCRQLDHEAKPGANDTGGSSSFAHGGGKTTTGTFCGSETAVTKNDAKLSAMRDGAASSSPFPSISPRSPKLDSSSSPKLKSPPSPNSSPKLKSRAAILKEYMGITALPTSDQRWLNEEEEAARRRHALEATKFSDSALYPSLAPTSASAAAPGTRGGGVGTCVSGGTGGSIDSRLQTPAAAAEGGAARVLAQPNPAAQQRKPAGWSKITADNGFFPTLPSHALPHDPRKIGGSSFSTSSVRSTATAAAAAPAVASGSKGAAKNDLGDAAAADRADSAEDLQRQYSAPLRSSFDLGTLLVQQQQQRGRGARHR